MGYLDLPIREIHKALGEGRVSPLELVEEAAKRIESDDCNAFEAVLLDQARQEAAKIGLFEEDNLLWGIPYVCKDNFSTKGIETTASSNILNGYVPLFDASVVKKLKERKCLLLAKTTLDELAMGGTGTTGHKGKTYNPFDPSHERMVGGSSCGSAASLAHGDAVFATGSDTGDSVRKPASFAGLVGFKPTWGRISRYGLFPFAPSLDHVGYFTHYVEDAAILLNALAGHDEMDFTSSFEPVKDYTAKLGEGLKGKKLLVIQEIIDSIDDAVNKEKFLALVKAIEKEGAEVVYASFGLELLRSIYATYIVISCAEATSNDANLDGIKFGPYYGGASYQEVMANARTKGFSELIKRRFVIGSFALMKENQEDLFLRAQRNRAKIVEKVNSLLQGVDAILVPAAPSIAPKFFSASDRLSSEYLIADNHLALGNFSGLPSITLPYAFHGGMPLGINLMGKAFAEDELFALAKGIEELTGLAGLSVYAEKEGNL